VLLLSYCYHVLIASASSNDGIGVTIDGFTIQDGKATSGNILNITVNENVFSPYDGGGISIAYGKNTLRNNTFLANLAKNNGGGIYTYNGTNTLTNNTFLGNSAKNNGGGGIYTEKGRNTLTENTFSKNSATKGGGIYTYQGINTLAQNTLSTNSATSDGGGIYTYISTNTLTNNTLSANSATKGGGIYTNQGTNTLTNNIFWGNRKSNDASVQGADYYADGTHSNTFKNNLLQLASSNYPVSASGTYAIGTAALGNLFAVSPKFIDASDINGMDSVPRTADDGLQLQIGSPCINAGIVVAGLTSDILGNPYVGNPDLGAYEGGIACTLDTALYVDASMSTSGNGSSWSTAYKTLDQALSAAQRCGNIRSIYIAKGIYKPTRKPYNYGEELFTTDKRDKTFHIRDSLAVCGGYPAGGGTRNVGANVTILSGDIDSLGNNADNCYHVVVALAASIGGVGVTIDGVTIQGGNANATYNNFFTVNGNQTVLRGGGGGIYIALGTNTLANNTLSANSATIGGGIHIIGGTNTVSNNTFSANLANDSGGAIYTQYTGTGINTLTNNTFLANSATYGGGIYLSGGTSTLTNNTLYGNSATNGTGGGIFTIRNGTNTLINNTLYANSAAFDGGGIYNVGSANTLTNNILWGNRKKIDGSGEYLESVQGADYSHAPSPSTIGSFLFENNLLQTNWTMANNTFRTGNLFSVNPKFTYVGGINGADDIPRTADDGLRLQTGSPCINAGISVAGVTADILGNPYTGNPDLGAYGGGILLPACPTDTALYVDASVSVSGNGVSWVTAYKTLDEALSTTHRCPVVKRINVAKGTYKPTRKPYSGGGTLTTADVRDKTFHLRDGLSVFGGYPAGGGTRNSGANVTILSGDIGSSGSPSDYAYHVVLASAALIGGVGVTLDGFTIQDGNANGSSNITVNGNQITNNAGGGIYTYNGRNTLINNKFSANSATKGGGIYTSSGTNTLTNNTLSANSATQDGAGIYTASGTNTLINNILSANSATKGGGIYTSSGTNTLVNNTVATNSATSNGGAIYTVAGTNTLTNNIFWGNQKSTSTKVQGADYYAESTNGNTFKNNLLQLASSNYPVSASGTYALGAAGSGNLFAQNPLFLDAADIDGVDNIQRTDDDGLRLRTSSPAIGAGIPVAGVTTDILGTPYTGNPNLGAYTGNISLCFAPKTFAVTGGGDYCIGGVGFAVGLAQSDANVEYQLKRDGIAIGALIRGSDSTMNFGNQTIAGTYTIVGTSANGTCNLAATPMTGQAAVVINALPMEPSVTTPIAYCQNAVATVVTATGANLKWYVAATGNNTIANAPTPSTTTAKAFSYWVSQTDMNGCESPRARINVAVNPLPTVPLVKTPVNTCQFTTAPALTATGTNLKWFTTAVGGNSTTTVVPNTATVANTNYWVSQTDTNSCESTRSLMQVIVNPLPAVPSVVTPINYCRTAKAPALTATGQNLKWYNVAIGGISTPTLLPKTDSVGTTAYWVTQTNALGCESNKTKMEVVVEGFKNALVQKITLCKDQYFGFDLKQPKYPNLTHAWTSTNGYTSNKQSDTLRKAGTYYVETTTELGCKSNDSLVIALDAAAIESNFAVATQLVTIDVIKVVNISNSVNDSSRWIIPAGLKVVGNNPALLEIVASDTGHYTLGLITYKGSCSAESYQNVHIYPKTYDQHANDTLYFVKTFTAYPNPNHGENLRVNIELSKESSVKLRLIDFDVNAVLDSRVLQGSDTYNVDYGAALRKGTYILFLESPYGRSVLKIIVL
jgi:parallel beta-helix repeat protein/predicted outer membrane repeat protein